MPLFMDFHKIPGITLEDVRKAHLADLAVQEKYGVKYHQFWLNQQAGTIFCLTEGPDMETCAMVHRLAHGNVACAMTEVEPGYYKLFMGEIHRIDHGHIVQNENGSFDLGYRTIVVFSLQSFVDSNGWPDRENGPARERTRQMMFEQIDEYHGRRLKWAADESLVAVFNDPVNAVDCARNVQNLLSTGNPNEVFRIALSAGQPVTENGEFFTTALNLGHRLSCVARNNQILISSLVRDLCNDDQLTSSPPFVKSLTAAEESFISSLVGLAEQNLSNEKFFIDDLCRDMGVSRAQLYRRITSISGESPNDLLTSLRLNKAVTMLRRKAGNVAQIALEVGYRNPSYFARCFTKKFGCTPSRFAAMASHANESARKR